MSLRSIFLMLVLALLALFTAVNWNAVVAPTTLSLLFTTVQAPIGLVMLAVTVLLVALFLAYLALIQTHMILDARRTARELSAQRDLADQAEASRFTDLRSFLEHRLQVIESSIADAHARTASHVDQLDSGLRTAIEHVEMSVSAIIGELEDRLEGRPAEGAGRSV